MGIAFGSVEAQRIYQSVLSRTLPGVKAKAEELFSEAAKGVEDGSKLSEGEAREVEASLNQYDCGHLHFLWGKLYDHHSVGKALEEYRDWYKFGNYYLDKKAEKLTASYELFVNKHPKSTFAAEALFRLGHLYFLVIHQDEKAVTAYENLVAAHPSSPQATDALFDLINLYAYNGNNEQAFHFSKTWLEKKPYIPRRIDYSAPRYNERKSAVLMFQAEYHREKGNLNTAKQLYRTIISREDHFSNIAKGALFDLDRDTEYIDEWPEYFRHKAHILKEKGERLLYNKQDLDAAEKTFTSMLVSARKGKDSSFLQQAEMALAEIRLRRCKSFSSALKVLDELKEKGKLDDFLRYQHLVPMQFSETLLIGAFLNSLPEIKEIKIAVVAKIDKIERETKTPRDYYMLFFRDDNGWKAVDNHRVLNLNLENLRSESLESLIRTIEKSSGFKIYHSSSKSKLFASSLREFHFHDRWPYYEISLRLEEGRMPEEAKRMLAMLKTEFEGQENFRERLIAFAKAFYKLPKNHFINLRAVDFKGVKDKRLREAGAVGSYSRDKKIDIESADSSIPSHELVHHWDNAIATGYDGRDLSPGDPSLIFYKISWDKWSKAACGYLGKPCGGWKMKASAVRDDFSREYGMSDGYEDLATSAESYIEGNGNLSRLKVRQQMASGNFKPAAKYLFNKYIRSADPADGLCFEYSISSWNPALSMKEVRTKLKAWLAAHPRSVEQSTLSAIDEIEQTYKEFKSLKR